METITYNQIIACTFWMMLKLFTFLSIKLPIIILRSVIFTLLRRQLTKFQLYSIICLIVFKLNSIIKKRYTKYFNNIKFRAHTKIISSSKDLNKQIPAHEHTVVIKNTDVNKLNLVIGRKSLCFQGLPELKGVKQHNQYRPTSLLLLNLQTRQCESYRG